MNEKHELQLLLLLTPDILIPLRSSSCDVWFLSGGLKV